MKINCFGVGTDPSEDSMTHGAMRATHLTLVKLKRKQKEKKWKKRRKTEIMRGEEREGKGALRSLYDLRRPGSRLPTGQGLKSDYTERATCGYRKLHVSSRFRSGGS